MIPLPIALGLYQDRSLPNSNQMCKNWYPSIVQTQGLSQQVLYGTPGLNEVANAGGISRINRGSHTKDGIPYFVQGDRLFNLIKTTPLGVDTFTVNDLGEIAGTSRVSMDDNGTQLMIVSDGQGYIYNQSANWNVSTTDNSNAFLSVTYGDGTYVAVSTGTSNAVITSTDAITWTDRTAANTNSWKSVTYGNSLFAAVSNIGAGDYVMTSPDGITWTGRTSSSSAWNGISYGGSLFVGVGNSGALMTSSDGITWTNRTAASVIDWQSVAYGDGLYVAVADSGTDRVMTSPDGITWTTRTPASDSTWVSVTYAEGLFVAVSLDQAGLIMTSPDGINWVLRDNPSNAGLTNVAYGNGIFTAIGYDSGIDASLNCVTINSDDGILWHLPEVLPAAQNQFFALTFGGGKFVAVANTGINTDSRIMYENGGGASLQNIVNVDTDFDANGSPENVRFIDSYFLVTTDEKKFIRSDANNGLSWNALNFGTAEADPDSIKALEIDNNKAFLFGAETIEPFDNIGGSGFGFVRSGLLYNKGVSSGDAVVKTTAGIAFLGQGQDESPAMWSLSAGQLIKISHPGIDNEINSYSLSDLESCFAQYYAEAGEFFVSFTFPLKTFVYGFASELWHERESSGLRWRVNSLTKAYGTIFAGDSIDGRIGELALDIYHEYDNFIEAQVSSPNFSNQGDMAFYPKIEATMEAGMGNADTPNPVLTYDYSDNGKIFKGARSRLLGKKGKYNMRTIWRRNGRASRYRTNRFTFTGKNKRAFLKLEAEIEA